jgi:hypothetical protein
MKNKIIAALLGASLFASAVVCIAFVALQHSESAVVPAKKTKAQDPALSEEEARLALIAMLESKEERRFENWEFQAKMLKEKAKDRLVFVKGPQTSITSETWTCDLESRSFHLLSQVGGCLVGSSGVFERMGDHWIARETQRSYAHNKKG